MEHTEYIEVNGKRYQVYGGEVKKNSSFDAVPPGWGIKYDLEALEISHADAIRQLGLSCNDFEKLLAGEIPLTIEIAQKLEKMGLRDTALWMRLQASYEEHPKHPSRGGARVGSGPKPKGFSSKQVRISAPSEDMKEIEGWLKAQPNAAYALAKLIQAQLKTNTL